MEEYLEKSNLDNSSQTEPTKNKQGLKKIGRFFGRLGLCVIILAVLFYPMLFTLLIYSAAGVWTVTQFLGMITIPLLVIYNVFSNRKKRSLLFSCVFAAAVILLTVINFKYIEYDQSLVVETDPNIRTYEYLPFDEDSKIVVLDQEASLQLEEDLPILDGATAAFPVYSAFVNAVYPDTTELYDGVFEYNTTSGGYEFLAERKTDIFFGAYPSAEQIEYARSLRTEFVYTQMGWEAFVFIVSKDNPVDNLTSEQIRGIYSGEITNWKEVGGRNEPIIPFQRDEGSGSQSMLIRFMGGTPIIEPDIEEVDSGMGGIIEQVADYRNKPGSIGFSFRYYVEGIIQNPDIKMLSVDGVAPTVENVRSGAYPITAPVYAVTYEGNDNPNVPVLLEWILSEEGQEIIERTGYVGIGAE